MSDDKTRLVLPGQTIMVPRLVKRSVQMLLGFALSASLILAVMVANGLFSGRNASWQTGLNVWLVFIKRPDIHATMLLTSAVTVLFVYWQQRREGRR